MASTSIEVIILAATFALAASSLTYQAPRKLRICNAYAWKKPLDIYLVASQKMLTGNLPLAYKECRDLTTPLNEGDQIDFKSGELDVGTFHATGLPESQASLLIIPHRRDSDSMAVQFDSHAFSELQNAQVAVVDTYKGFAGSTVHIGDAPTPPQQSLQAQLLAKAQSMITGDEQPPPQHRPTEELRYNSVLALNEGKYQISLVNELGHEANQSPMDVKNSENYIVMRVGSHTDPEKSRASLPKNVADFPEELVVFPQLERSSAVSATVTAAFACYLVTFASVL